MSIPARRSIEALEHPAKHPRSSLPLEANTQIAQIQFFELSEDRESLIAVLLPKE
jgi:hypothetical protein